ncbi:beta-phosphoglucomutase [Clostridium sp. UBA1652]|uniref:beta-phosphoglucomutase n=1 Tax=Clostridium sp. UBA1652 TaxID=1946348 RepID=UPI00257ECAB6|nr:beta-phosphoglucomutase [Clostridium sp. UBA1652]
MIKGVIFDLDGVLVSTDKMHFYAWKKLARKLGITNYTEEDNKRQKGVSRMESLEVVLSKGTIIYSREDKLRFAEEKNKYYVELLESLDSQAVLIDVIETLELLKDRGVLIGIGSASKNTPLILEKTGLNKYIDEVSCGLDVTKSKPDPEVFIVAAEKLNLKNEECLVVEDSKSGIVAARACHMRSLGVGPEHEQLGADYNSLTMQSNVDWDELLS